ncbi:MAG: pyridoxal phosphate-dependent aminotransferase [Anaerolineales bacterium]|nr:pyridoxal phosphate-dependent aminotransferase [Anaerolineales bacterium]
MTSQTNPESGVVEEQFSDRPVFATETLGVLPFGEHISCLAHIPPSRMFIVKRSLNGYTEKYPDEPVYDASQGDGGASLPGVPEPLLRRAVEIHIKRGTSYDPPTGSAEFKKAIVEQYWRLDSSLNYGPENVSATVGGRDGLIKAYQAVLALGFGRLGDAVLVSRVPWISYTWGPAGVGANTLLAPGSEADGWRMTPEAIRESVKYAESQNRNIAVLVITSPDNPTGRWLSPGEQINLAHAALDAGIPYVLFDWIYHHVTDREPMDLNAMLGAFGPGERERLIFLDGLTKSLGGSNIRGAHLIAPAGMIRFINAQASHSVIPPFFPQAVTLAAIEAGFDQAIQPIVEPTNHSRRYLREFLSEQGFQFILDQGYYAFINAGEWIEFMGWDDSEALGQYLANSYGVAVVPGVHFSVFGKRWIRFSYASEPDYTMAAARRLKEGLDSLT